MEKMNYSLFDHILQVDNFFNEDECKHYINFFEYVDSCGFTFKRNDSPKHIKDDTALSIMQLGELNYKLQPFGPTSKIFVDKFWEHAYKPYSTEFSILGEAARHNINTLKIQKTLPGEGYHRWHFENDQPLQITRILTFILYLNDVDSGGETEFLYYPRRIEAKQGRLVLFPGGFTHTHRGNQPLSSEKYIVTGWVYYGE